MTMQDAFFVQTFYSGTVAAKLLEARELQELYGTAMKACPEIREGLVRLHDYALALEAHMQFMQLGRLCSSCASQADGGCCSASMADNTDSIMLLTNMLLGIEVNSAPDHAENCCYLGEQGCLFAIKPFFCLTYNCTHILDSADSISLAGLYRQAGAVMSQQSRLEALLLAAISHDSRERRSSCIKQNRQ